MTDYGRAVRSLLRKAGWSRARQGGKGSHEIWSASGGSGKKVSVPVHIKSRHTANAILKEADVGKKF